MYHTIDNFQNDSGMKTKTYYDKSSGCNYFVDSNGDIYEYDDIKIVTEVKDEKVIVNKVQASTGMIIPGTCKVFNTILNYNNSKLGKYMHGMDISESKHAISLSVMNSTNLLQTFYDYRDYSHVSSGLNHEHREIACIDLDIDMCLDINDILKSINTANMPLPDYALKNKNTNHWQIAWFIHPIRIKKYYIDYDQVSLNTVANCIKSRDFPEKNKFNFLNKALAYVFNEASGIKQYGVEATAFDNQKYADTKFTGWRLRNLCDVNTHETYAILRNQHGEFQRLLTQEELLDICKRGQHWNDQYMIENFIGDLGFDINDAINGFIPTRYVYECIDGQYSLNSITQTKHSNNKLITHNIPKRNENDHETTGLLDLAEPYQEGRNSYIRYATMEIIRKNSGDISFEDCYKKVETAFKRQCRIGFLGTKNANEYSKKNLYADSLGAYNYSISTFDSSKCSHWTSEDRKNSYITKHCKKIARLITEIMFLSDNDFIGSDNKIKQVDLHKMFHSSKYDELKISKSTICNDMKEIQSLINDAEQSEINFYFAEYRRRLDQVIESKKVLNHLKKRCNEGVNVSPEKMDKAYRLLDMYTERFEAICSPGIEEYIERYLLNHESFSHDSYIEFSERLSIDSINIQILYSLYKDLNPPNS